jgi:hypothetical protein
MTRFRFRPEQLRRRGDPSDDLVLDRDHGMIRITCPNGREGRFEIQTLDDPSISTENICRGFLAIRSANALYRNPSHFVTSLTRGESLMLVCMRLDSFRTSR